jgi:hypothetical protein
MHRRQFGTILAAVVTWTTFYPLAGTAAAQTSPAPDDIVRIEGKVAWLSAQKMLVARHDGPPVPVDLSQVDQDEYMRLLSGDRVIVIGRLTRERDRVVATSVRRIE